MAILEALQYRTCDSEDDPDDHRPRSLWAAAVDAIDPGGNFVGDLCLFVDLVAPGDQVPLHAHPVNELIVLTEGTARFRLDDETKEIGAGAVIFVPAGTPHGARNDGTAPARFLGIFATQQVGLSYLERNPAPGTEGQPPRPPFELDVSVEAEAPGFQSSAGH